MNFTENQIKAGAAAMIELCQQYRRRGESMPSRHDEARACLAAVEAAAESDLAALVASYYRREVGRLMQQAEHWAEHDKPLAVHHRVTKADAYYQVFCAFDRREMNVFEIMRRELASPLVKPEGTYPPGLMIHSYRDPSFVALKLRSSEKWRTDFENAPTEAYEFFLVRPKGVHPASGKAFHPTIVQRIDGKFYTSTNELEPIYFGQNESDDHPLKTTLEWRHFPADWLAPSEAA